MWRASLLCELPFATKYLRKVSMLEHLYVIHCLYVTRSATIIVKLFGAQKFTSLTYNLSILGYQTNFMFIHTVPWQSYATPLSKQCGSSVGAPQVLARCCHFHPFIPVALPVSSGVLDLSNSMIARDGGGEKDKKHGLSMVLCSIRSR